MLVVPRRACHVLVVPRKGVSCVGDPEEKCSKSLFKQLV